MPCHDYYCMHYNNDNAYINYYVIKSPIVASLVATTCKLHSLFGTLMNCIMWTCNIHALSEQSCKFSMLINYYIRCDNWPMIATCQSSWRCLFWGNMEGYNVLLSHAWPMERTDQWGTSSPRPREVIKDLYQISVHVNGHTIMLLHKINVQHAILLLLEPEILHA